MVIDWGRFIKNRSEIPLEELDKYAGQWIVWSPDGTHIAAGSGESEEALIELLEKTGRDPSDYVFGYIDQADMGTI